MKTQGELRQQARAAKKWILVDDNSDMVGVVSEVLSTMTDTEISSFNCPEAAAEALEADPCGFELLITDFDMPGMNGAELLRRVRVANPELKALLITGNIEITASVAFALGFDALCHKPFSMDQIAVALAGLEETEDRLEAA